MIRVGIHLLLRLLISHLSWSILSPDFTLSCALVSLYLVGRTQLILRSSNLMLAIGIIVMSRCVSYSFLLVLIVLIFHILILIQHIWISSCCRWGRLRVWNGDRRKHLHLWNSLSLPHILSNHQLIIQVQFICLYNRKSTLSQTLTYLIYRMSCLFVFKIDVMFVQVVVHLCCQLRARNFKFE